MCFVRATGKTKSRKNFGLAGAAEGINPGSEDFVGGSFEVEEFDAEADARLDDANDDKGFEDLALAGELQASAAVWRKRPAGANKAAAKGDVGRDAFNLLAGLLVGEFRVGSERVSDGVATVAYTSNAQGRGACAVRHGDDFVHSKISIHAETPRAPQGG